MSKWWLRIGLVAIGLLLGALQVHAQALTQICTSVGVTTSGVTIYSCRPGLAPYQSQALGTVAITVGSSTALSISPIPTGATFAVIESNNPVKWADGGVVPTANLGMPLSGSTTLNYSSVPLTGISFISVSGSTSVTASFYK